MNWTSWFFISEYLMCNKPCCEHMTHRLYNIQNDMEILGWKNKRLVISWTRNDFWLDLALGQWALANENSKKEFIDSYNSRILKKSSIDKYHTGVISSDVRIPPQRRNSPISRPETATRNLDFLPKLSFQNFETNLPKASFILDGLENSVTEIGKRH